MPLKLGNVNEDVVIVQKELNRIAANYPSIPRIANTNGIFEASTQTAVKQFQNIFNLAQDGIVGKETWYKIKQIYNGIKGLSELYSEGITLNEFDSEFQPILKKGSNGRDVKVLQYYLSFIGEFNLKLPYVTVDGYFGQETYDAVLTFQNFYGLDVDGIVGESTWAMIANAYDGVLTSLPSEYRSYSAFLYPGNAITTGASGKIIEQLQTFLRVISENDSSVPSVTVDGYYGDETKNAVLAVQRINGLDQTGQIGPLTWNAIINMYNRYK